MKFIWNIIVLILLYAIIFICVFLGMGLAMLALEGMSKGLNALARWMRAKRTQRWNGGVRVHNVKVVA